MTPRCPNCNAPIPLTEAQQQVEDGAVLALIQALSRTASVQDAYARLRRDGYVIVREVLP